MYSGSALAEPGAFRLRAREHFQRSWISLGSGPTEAHFTPASTINAWWEVPKRWAAGLFVNFGSPKADAAALPGSTDRPSLLQAGVEAKRWLRPGSLGPFVRAGLGWARLKTDGAAGTVHAGGWYLGVGWEFPVWKLGLAPEIGFRHLLIEGGGRALMLTPSLGVHFYVFPGDPAPEG